MLTQKINMEIQACVMNAFSAGILKFIASSAHHALSGLCRSMERPGVMKIMRITSKRVENPIKL